jgi:hypothetical protein
MKNTEVVSVDARIGSQISIAPGQFEDTLTYKLLSRYDSHHVQLAVRGDGPCLVEVIKNGKAQHAYVTDNAGVLSADFLTVLDGIDREMTVRVGNTGVGVWHGNVDLKVTNFRDADVIELLADLVE